MTLAFKDRQPVHRRSLPPLQIPIREWRFWVIQLMVAGIVAIHSLLEWREQNGELHGFLDGIHTLPTPSFIVPVLLAGLWYGLVGGLMTGFLTLVITVPNLIIFHSEDFDWLGESVTNLIVIAVGIITALIVERNNRLRYEAESSQRRLQALWDVAGNLGRYEDGRRMATEVVAGLAANSSIVAAGFAATDSAPETGPIVAGPEPITDRIRLAAESLSAIDLADIPQRIDRLLAFPVATAHRHYGALLLACHDDTVASADAVVFSLVANEMAEVLENLDHRDKERNDLLNYARAVTMAQERERRRIARDLHDGPAQSMVMLKRGLDRLTASIETDPQKRDDTGQLMELVQSTLASLQRTTQALRPLVLDDLGLVPALRSLVERRSKRGHITVSFQLAGEERRLDADAELAAYRIAQEALTNIERHAATEAAELDLKFESARTVLTITDHGSGFVPQPWHSVEKFGIVGMNERAELVGGRLRINSRLGDGTVVELVLPF